MERLPDNIAKTQWNNRLKTVALSTVFLLGIAVFALTLFFMIALPISLAPNSGFDLASALSDPKMQVKIARFFLKVLFFSLAGALYFVYRDIKNIGAIFSADRLEMRTTDPFYRTLEQKCIERGVTVPDLYLFRKNAFPVDGISACVAQGAGGKSALILTHEDLNLTPDLQEALAAQVVQRLYTKDTWFMTLYCFLGHFPFHMSRATNVIGRYLFWLPMKAADLVITPFRPLILDLRLARLDMGAVEITKNAESMGRFLQHLMTLEEVERFIHAPYLSLFIAASGKTREKALTTS